MTVMLRALRPLVLPVLLFLVAGVMLSLVVLRPNAHAPHSTPIPDHGNATMTALQHALHAALDQEGLFAGDAAATRMQALRAANRHLRMPVLQYESSEPEVVAQSGDFALERTRMEIRFTPLHEGDALALLDALGANGAGRMHVRACRMRDTRMTGQSRSLPGSERFEADCRIDWFTIAVPEPAS